MTRLLTFLFCVVLSVMASAASLSPDTTAQCVKPIQVYAASSTDGKTAYVVAANGTNVASLSTATYEVQYKLGTDSVWIAGGIFTIVPTAPKPDTLVNLKPCSKYVFRVRTVCSPAQKSDWVNGDFVTQGCTTPAPCSKVQQIGFTALDSTSAIGAWSQGGSGKYYAQYKIAADSVTSWSNDSTTLTNYTIKNLKKCTPYVVRIITVCNGKQDTIATRFETICPKPIPTVCPAPTVLTATVVGDTAVTFKWRKAVLDGKVDRLTVIATNGDFKKTYDITDTTFTIKDLPRCRNYNAAVITQCDSTHYSLPSNYASFSTSGCVVTCPKVTELSFQGVDSVSAAGQWNATGSIKYFVEYKMAADSIKTWSRDSATTTSIKLKNLKPCTTYIVRVLSVCNGKLDTGAISKFQTICPVVKFVCNAPKNLTDTVIADTTVQFNWASSGANSVYVVSISYPGSTARKSYIATTNSLTVKDLPKCFSYYASVALRCDSTHTSEASNYVQFALKGCPPPPCNKIGLISISDVTTTSLDVSWNKSGSGKYIVRHKIAVDSIKTWVNDTVSTEDFIVKNLAPCTAYTFNVVANCNGKLDTSSSIKITTLCPRPVCVLPYGIGVKITADTVATLSWKSNGAKSFVLQYRQTTSATLPWTTVSAVDSFSVLKLKTCSYYQVRLRATCDSTNPNWLYYEFKTTGSCVTTVCSKPSTIQTQFAGTSTYVFWYYPTASNATQPIFEIQYKATADSVWSGSIKSNSVYTVLSGLVNCKQYTVRVRAACSATSSSDWVAYTFYAGLRCNVAGGPPPIKAPDLSNVSVSPNPSASEPTVAFDLTRDAKVTIKVFNLTGNNLINLDLGILPAGTYFQTVNNASFLNQGVYIISTQAGSSAPVTTRWMKL